LRKAQDFEVETDDGSKRSPAASGAATATALVAMTVTSKALAYVQDSGFAIETTTKEKGEPEADSTGLPAGIDGSGTNKEDPAAALASNAAGMKSATSSREKEYADLARAALRGDAGALATMYEQYGKRSKWRPKLRSMLTMQLSTEEQV